MHLRIWLFCLLLLCLCVAAADDDDTTCSATKRCKNGCCNKSGNCGFGPDYCGTNCRSDCDRKAECNPGFGSKWAKNDKCPLNVCCSKHGYCGTTKEYCGSKKVKRPSCGKTNGVSRVVGYFEGWARTRPCEKFWPEQIPVGLYTHINFAFATIDPKTFEVKADKESDLNTYSRLMAQKKKDPELKVYLAVGGWTFNDPGPTEKTFSDLAASVPRQKAFMKSLQSFMSTHNFDGLDLDWEYPQAIDRGGREVDFANFPKFMASLKKMLDANDKGLTITLPASYWYLQHFDIKKLEKTVDFFNIMSYDLHGVWDKNATWTKPYLNAHTNLTEIELALDLLWRNDIEPSNVVLGMGFYGRAFTVQTASCKKPGCLFKDPGNAGKCSREAGVLLNSEIDSIIKERNLKPQLYEEEAVKVATWGNQWVSYDDEETFKLKSEYAQSRCLGGVMVWAISHDTKDAKYNQAFAKAVGRKLSKRSLDDEEAYEIKEVPNEQCRWTNCKESCPKGWVPVPRSDGGARTKKGEMMWDETGCGGDGRHTFCCPKGDKMPTCGWYGFKNGKCTKGGSCPSDMVEIGSNSMYCHKKQNYESACCTTDIKNMKVYGTCEWGLYPNCDDQDECRNPNGDLTKSHVWARSASGSGGGKCNPKENPHGLLIPGTQFRKLCCTVEPNLRFEKCEWYKDVGPAPNPHPNGFCRSGCPAGLVRVAIDTEVDTCAVAGKGGMARCCQTSYSDAFEVENPKLDAARSVMKEWIDNPTCPRPSSGIFRRADQLDGVVVNASLAIELASRDDKTDKITPLVILASILSGSGSPAILEETVKIWDGFVEDKFPYLSSRSIKNFLGLRPQSQNDGPEESARLVICSPYSYNARIAAAQGKDSGSNTKWINCTYAVCNKDGVCGDGDDEIVARRRRALLPTRSTHLSPKHHMLHVRQGKPKVTHLDLDPGDDEDKVRIEFEIPQHDPPRKLEEKKHPAVENTAEYENPDDCSDPSLKPGGGTFDGSNNFHTEHTVDKSVVMRFFSAAATGELESGRTPRYGPIPIEFLEQMQWLGLRDEFWPEIPGNPDFEEGNMYSRVMECLGSQTNNRNFAIAISDLNWAKGQLMMLNNPIAPNRQDRQVRENIDYVMGVMRAIVATFEYMNTDSSPGPNVRTKISNVINEILTQFVHAEVIWERENRDNPVWIAQFFNEWIRDFYGEVTANAQRFLRTMIPQVRRYWAPRTGDQARQVMEDIRSIEDDIDGLHIWTEWETPVLEDDSPPQSEDEDSSDEDGDPMDEDDDSSDGSDDSMDEDTDMSG